MLIIQEVLRMLFIGAPFIANLTIINLETNLLCKHSKFYVASFH